MDMTGFGIASMLAMIMTLIGVHIVGLIFGGGPSVIR